MTEPKKRYYGKYRGTVVTNADPYLKGRIQALVTVGGTPLPMWAEACTPLAGPLYGLYAVPPTGAGVWIEFEEGDLEKPIWSGCWWMDGEVTAMLQPDLQPPDPVTSPQTIVLRVPTARIKLDTLTGTVTMETLVPPATPATPTGVKITPLGVEISFGPTRIIRITAAGVDINNTTLTIL